MKVLGLTCGRKLSNTEILVKEALMGAEETGAEVELVRLLDLNIKPCTGCNSCVIDLFERGGSNWTTFALPLMNIFILPFQWMTFRPSCKNIKII